MKQVRVGWPNPTTKSRRHILAIIEPLSEGKVRLELRVGQKSGLISENGRLEQAPRDTSKENDPSQKDKGYITLLPDADLPDGIEGWIKTALEFAKHAYGLATQS
jgi:hypothetical protein